MLQKKPFSWLFPVFTALATFGLSASAWASEAELHIPELNQTFASVGLSGTQILFAGLVVAILGMVFLLSLLVRRPIVAWFAHALPQSLQKDERPLGPNYFQHSTLAWGMNFALITGWLGGLIPALSAMRLRPLESLR